MSVTFVTYGDKYASSRYRCSIPQRALEALGVPRGNDWLVIGKHGFWTWEDVAKMGYRAVCFDVCDDHFEGPLDEHYHTSCLRADLVTCNSEEMARRIYDRTGRDAIVIPDPYEQQQKSPYVGDNLLWYGHKSNLRDIAPYVGSLPKLEIITNAEGFTQWSPLEMDRAFDNCGMVVIPTGKSMCKSGNRAIEAIRRGRFVVAGYLPAYSDLGIWIGNIKDGVRWALENQEEVIRRIIHSQAYVNAMYSPERIAGLWKTALNQ